MSQKKSKYSGFTLIEMLIVMSILVILTGLSFATYQNMQTTIRLNEFVNGLEQNIRKVQRDAMLLEKKPDEGWIYGLGIDLRSINNATDGTFGVYYPFKWCSGFDEYGDNIKTRSAVPDFDPNLSYETGNGSIPPGAILEARNCLNTNELRKYAPYGDWGIGIMGAGKQQVSVYLEPIYRDDGDLEVEPAYILFESVTGRAFFYDAGGYLLNFDYENMTPVSNSEPIIIRITPLRGGNGKRIIISHISGRILVEANDEP